MNIKSASRIALSISVEKNRFLPRHCFTTSSRPGCEDKTKEALFIQETNKYSISGLKFRVYHLLTSKIGNFSEFHESILGLLKSTTVTLISGHFSAMTLHVGPPTYPAPIQQMDLIEFISSWSEQAANASKMKRGGLIFSVYLEHFEDFQLVVSGISKGYSFARRWLVSFGCKSRRSGDKQRWRPVDSGHKKPSRFLDQFSFPLKVRKTGISLSSPKYNLRAVSLFRSKIWSVTRTRNLNFTKL